MVFFNFFPRFFSYHLSKIGGKSPLTPFYINTSSSFRFKSPLKNLVVDRYYSKMPSPSENSIVLKYSKINPNAFPPTKGSAKAAGYDLKSCQDVIVPARGTKLVDTGLRVELPEGCYGRIAPRSGLAVKCSIDVGAGVVDADYRGILKVVLFNHSDADFEVLKGDRIAQLICEKICYPEIEEVEEVGETARGEGGFGSTGTN